MISFACSSCSQTYSVSDDKAGKTAKCKRCGAVLKVPGDPQPEWVDDPPTPARPQSRGGPSDGGPPGIWRRRPRWQRYTVGVGGFLAFWWALYAGLTWSGAFNDRRLNQNGTHVPPARPPEPAVKTTEARARELVAKWLDGAKKGQDTSSYAAGWRIPSEGDHLFGGKLFLRSVRSYEILGVTSRPAEGSLATQDGMQTMSAVRVRVDYSDRDGRHVTNDHKVTVGDTGGFAYLMGAR